MLIEFRVANFRSFHEEQTLSLVASSGRDESLPENLIPCSKFNLLKSAAIYGANASGKSNLIRAFFCMKNFIQDSATKMNQGDEIPEIVPFSLSSETINQPSSFETTFIIEGMRHVYQFSATSKLVYKECLYTYPLNKPRCLFERSYDPETKKTDWAFRYELNKEGKTLKEKTRNNGLVLSRGAEQNIEILSDIYSWFRQDIWIFDMSNQPHQLIGQTADRIQKNKTLKSQLIKMIKHADVGIDNILVKEEPIQWEKLPNKEKMYLYAMSDMEVSSKSQFSLISINTLHKVFHSNKIMSFNMNEESNGTQRFFALAGPFLDALDKGATIVVDEIECSMHPLLVRKLIELFQSPEVNQKGAQLVFATHDSTLMDPELFRRDQIWITEKNSKGATELYSLYDFDTKDRPRNTERFQRNYLAGRYGGVPKFGPIFEDLEIK